MLKGMYGDATPLVKLFIFIGVLLVCTALFSLAGLAIAPLIFGQEAILGSIRPDGLFNPQSIAALKFLQIISQIGIMIVPAFIAAIIFWKKGSSFLNTDKIPLVKSLILIVVLIICASPFLNFLIELNSRLQLPAYLQRLQDWMVRYEVQAAKLTEALLKMDSSSDLFLNLFMVGLLPAIGEEFLFRGVIQKLFRELISNAHVAIFLTAIFFSAIHMQFFGFLPRFLLGLLFGYLLFWSGSIWLPVLAHFTNNAMAVIFAWYQQRNQLSFNPDTIGTTSGDWWLLTLSIIIVAVITFYFRNKMEQEIATDSQIEN